MHSKIRLLILSVGIGIGLTLSLLGLLGGVFVKRPLVHAAGPRFVATTGSDSANDCTNSAAPCATVQHAVDVADPGDEIRVAAGVYTGVEERPRSDIFVTGIVSQVVYISKTVTVRGGYTTTNWTTSNPTAHPTTLDAEEMGRVIYITGNISPTIDGLQLTRGRATGLGGHLLGAFTDSDAGSGIYVISATVSLQNNRIYQSTILGRSFIGDGLYLFNSENSTVVDNVIENNRASNFSGGVAVVDSPGILLMTNVISNNSSVGPSLSFNGGVGFANSPYLSMIGNTVSGNMGQNGCGGICIATSDTITLENNIVTDNFAGGQGSAGGLALGDSDAVLINNVISNNRAGNSGNQSGSGMIILDSSVKMLHTTVVSNSGGDGSGVAVADLASTVALTNTIVASHTVGITVTNGNTVTLNGVLWFNNSANSGNTGAVVATNEHTGDPVFKEDGYHISIGSAAILRGANSFVQTDIDGEPRRPIGTDLGADEFYFRFFLPIIPMDYEP